MKLLIKLLDNASANEEIKTIVFGDQRSLGMEPYGLEFYSLTSYDDGNICRNTDEALLLSYVVFILILLTNRHQSYAMTSDMAPSCDI